MSEVSSVDAVRSHAAGGDSPPLLRVSRVSKAFGAIRAVDDVSFELAAGEVVGLVGDNGAGKSTLVKIISGVHKPDSGEIWVEGTKATLSGPADARARGIETVYQHLALVEQLDIPANLFLGREIMAQNPIARTFGFLRRREMVRKTREALDTLHVNVPVIDMPVARLSGGQRQAAAIARSVFWGRKLLLLDEPTAALGVEESEQALQLIPRLRKAGVGIVMISHNLEHVFRVAGRVIVMRQGRVTTDRRADRVSMNEVVEYITGARTEQAAASAGED